MLKNSWNAQTDKGGPDNTESHVSTCQSTPRLRGTIEGQIVTQIYEKVAELSLDARCGTSEAIKEKVTRR